MVTGSKKSGKKVRSANKSKKLIASRKFKRIHALLIVMVVAAVGALVVYRSYAANPPLCTKGTRSIGYEIGFKNGKGYKIRLCKIDGFKSRGSEDSGAVRVSSTASARWLSLYNSARASGINLVADSSFRSHRKQTEMYNCYKSGRCKNYTAPPGYSNHQSGTAIDIDIVPGLNNDPTLDQCKRNPGKYPVYNWLSKNAHKHGRYAKVASECWHWSPDGY